jgi:uncharacterized membrane-anchored protein
MLRHFLLLLCLQLVTLAQDKDLSPIKGPTEGKLGNLATVKVKPDYLFYEGAEARKLLERMENIPDGDELGIIQSPDKAWFAIFQFDDTGYIKDDEKDSLNAQEMLTSIQEGTRAANEERKKRGWGTVELVGWIQPPHYDSTSHNLEWSLKGKDDQGGLVANHNTRLLGRRGVMKVQLVTDADQLAAATADFNSMLKDYSFTPDNQYSAFRQGDKVAEYGLGALVIGAGAAAVANKGIFKTFWKVIVAAVIGLGGLIKKLFDGRQQAPPSSEEPTQS